MRKRFHSSRHNGGARCEDDVFDAPRRDGGHPLAAVDSFPSDLLKDDCAKGVLLVDGGLLPPIMGIPPTVDETDPRRGRARQLDRASADGSASGDAVRADAEVPVGAALTLSFDQQRLSPKAGTQIVFVVSAGQVDDGLRCGPGGARLAVLVVRRDARLPREHDVARDDGRPRHARHRRRARRLRHARRARRPDERHRRAVRPRATSQADGAADGGASPPPQIWRRLRRDRRAVRARRARRRRLRDRAVPSAAVAEARRTTAWKRTARMRMVERRRRRSRAISRGLAAVGRSSVGLRLER